MGRYYGKVGFLKDEIESETRPSRFEPEMEERYYSGNLLKNYASQQNAEKLVDDVTISDDLSIIADPYALNHFSSIKYVELFGTLWEAKSISVEYPRLRISFGGVYNGPTPSNP